MTLFENCCGVVGFGAVVVDQLWVVGISGGSVEFGNLIADRKRSAIAVGHRVALSRWRRGRKCAEIPLKADRNRASYLSARGPISLLGRGTRSSTAMGGKSKACGPEGVSDDRVAAGGVA